MTAFGMGSTRIGFHIVVTCLLVASTWSSCNAEYPLGDFAFEEKTPSFYDPGLYNVELYNGNDNAGYTDNPYYTENTAGAETDEGLYTETDEEVVISAAPGGSQGFVQTRGQQFSLNGKPLFVNGANLYYLMTLASDPSRRYLVTQILRESASVGVTVVRAWAFADGDGAWNLQMRPGVYSEATFRVCIGSHFNPWS